MVTVRPLPLTTREYCGPICGGAQNEATPPSQILDGVDVYLDHETRFASQPSWRCACGAELGRELIRSTASAVRLLNPVAVDPANVRGLHMRSIGRFDSIAADGGLSGKYPVLSRRCNCDAWSPEYLGMEQCPRHPQAELEALCASHWPCRRGSQPA